MADTVETVMQEEISAFRPDMPIRDAVARFVQTGHAAAPVVDDSGALIGILSQKDCFRSALNAGYYQQWSGTVVDHMTADVRTLDAATDLVAAAEAFLSEPYRAYPIIRDNSLVGMLTRADLLRAFLQFG